MSILTQCVGDTSPWCTHIPAHPVSRGTGCSSAQIFFSRVCTEQTVQEDRHAPPEQRAGMLLSSVTKATASSGLRLGRLAIVLWKILPYFDYLNSGFHSCGLMGEKAMAQTGSSCCWLCWYTDLCLRTTSPMSSASIQETATGWGAEVLASKLGKISRLFTVLDSRWQGWDAGRNMAFWNRKYKGPMGLGYTRRFPGIQ